MNVDLKVIKTISLKVKRMDTIRNLKEMVREKEKVLEYFQELYFSGEHLNDNVKLVDCGINDNSTLHLVLQNMGVTKLLVSTPSKQKTIEVEAKSDYTIAKIKSIIQAKHHINQDQYDLLYSGVLLENNKSLVSLNIKGGSILHLAFHPSDVLSVSVKMPSGEIVKMKVKVLYTVGDFKVILGYTVGFSNSDENLIYAGILLQDSKTLAFYDIKEDSILEILSSHQIQIFVKGWCGKTLSLFVHQYDTVRDVKNVISQKIRVPFLRYSLVFAGRSLMDGRDLACYGIKKDSTLQMVSHRHMLLFG